VNPYGWAYDPYFVDGVQYGYGGYLWPVYRPYAYRPFVGIHYRYPYRRW
jgi:hypothetical protein